MIELTKEEALSILKVLSMVEGYLFSVPNASHVIDIVDYPVELLSKKLQGVGSSE
jgi:hypothetical protein